jgi:two-component system, NtrC family, sensor kinase
LRTKRVNYVADQTIEASGPMAKLSGARSSVCVPMLKDNALVGVIAIYRQEVRPFTEKQIELVRNFAAQAVIAIENARLLNELRQRTDDLTESLEQQTATSAVLQVISSSPGELEPVFEAMLEKAVRICDAKFGNIYRWDGGVFRLFATINTPLALAEHRKRIPIRSDPKTLFGRMAVTKAAVHIADYTVDPLYIERVPETVASVELGGIRTILVVPMLKENELVGAFSVYRQEVRPFTDKQIELVKNFAAQAVIAIENARLLNELRESLEQQTATSKVLEVISRSAFDLQAVFETVAENSVRLCGADRAFIFRLDGELLRVAATFNAAPDFKEWVAQNPIRPGRHSTTARAALERRTIHIPDVLADAEYSYGAKDVETVRTVVAVPILKGDSLLGVMTIYHLEVRPITDKQIALLETFADQAAIAIENVRLLDALRQRTEDLGRSVGELRALGEVSQAVNSTLNLETVLSTIVAKAVQLSSTEAGAIYVFDDLQNAFHLRATYGMDQELIDALTQQRMGLDDPNVAQALAQPEPIQVADLREDAPTAVNEITLRAGYLARLVAPLRRGEDVVGFLVVRRRTPGTFPQNTIDLIKTFAAQSAVAIENARLFQNVQTSLENLRTTQDRLVQTQKLASLGQLTAGIAHEIKNPLNFVNNFSGVSAELIDELQEALKGAPLDERIGCEITELTNTLRDNLDKIVQHGKRADAIVKNMLLHSREGSGEHRPVDANDLVEESLNLAYHGARAEKQGFKITMERSFDPNAGQVDVFPQEITRALLNLISNGFYAATKRKEQDNREGYEPTLMATTKNLGDKVEIRIRDNGIGIPPDVKEKMFNPFFTTKPAGEGTGLGLSICHDIIVKQHSGSIEVDSRPGEYTEVRIVLPRAAAFPR